MFKKALAVLMAASITFSLAGCSSNKNTSTDKITLSINVKKGDVYKSHINVNTSTSTDVKGKKFNTSENISSDYVIHVSDSDKDTALMDYTYDAVKIETASDGKKESFDTKKPDKSSAISNLFTNMIGNGFTAAITKQGDIQQISGVDKLLGAMTKSVSEDTEVDRPQLAASLANLVDENAILSILQQTTKIYPSKDVTVGESWQADYTIGQVAYTTLKVLFTLEKVENDFAILNIKGDFVSDLTKETTIDGKRMKPKVGGKLLGNIKINKANGFISEGELKQSMSGEMQVLEAVKDNTMLPFEATSTITYATQKQ